MEQALIPFEQMKTMAETVAKSNLFGISNPDQALVLMLLCQSENIHPMQAVRDYHIINGKPALKADAMLARFQSAGGVVKWIEHTDQKVSAEFSHPQCPEPILIDWDMKRAEQAGLTGKATWKNYPRQLLRARVISEGVRATYPGACTGVYTPEEVQDFTPTEQKPSIEPPKKVEKAEPKPEVADAEIVPPEAPEPQEQASIESPKKTSIEDKLRAAKDNLGAKEYAAYLKKCGLKESDITADNINIVIRGMRARYEELKRA